MPNFGDFLSCVTLKFDESPWKTIGHLFYVTSSFVHHFLVWKRQIQMKNNHFLFCVTWNLTDDFGKQQCTSSMLFQALWIIS